MNSNFSRRRFLQGLAGLLAASPLDGIAAPAANTESFRFVFMTDLHLMRGGAKRSAQGTAACLQAIEKLDPRPDFLLVGGDLVHDAPFATIADANREYDLLLKTWHDNTSLHAHWIFGNHDLTATQLPAPPVADPRYAKGLFQQRLDTPKLFYSFDVKGWHFVIMDDVALLPDRNFEGRIPDDELAFLRADLQLHAAQPTILCTHIPFVSSLPSFHGKIPPYALCHNATALTGDFPGHNIRAVLAGHLHQYEKNVVGGVPFYNSGAVCANWWAGPLDGCPEGFAVVDLAADGTLKFDYRGYGWKA
jgi:Icc protein